MLADVRATVTENTDSELRLQVVRRACAGCDGKCVSLLLARHSDRPVVLSKDYFDQSDLDLCAGSQVLVQIPSITLIGLSLLVYLTPLILMLLSAVACAAVYSRSDAVVAGSAVFGFALGMLAVRILLGRLENNHSRRTVLVQSETAG